MPPKHPTPLTPYNVTLDAETVERLTKLGNGNLSNGIRIAAKLISDDPRILKLLDAIAALQ